MGWFKKAARSIFTKLLVVIILTGISVNLVVGGFFWHFRSAAGRPLHRNVEQYLDYIIKDLGQPPDLERAKQIGSQASLKIYYEGPEQSWSTAGNFSDIRKARWRDWGKASIVRLGRYHGNHFIEITRNSSRYTFGLDKGVDLDPERKRLVVILLCLLTLIFTGAFFSIRWILKPVRWLNEGVREVGRGNLKHRVPLKRSDELRDLAAAFNDMTERIRDMLHTKEQLLLDVSHELRSPLTRIKLGMEFLPDGTAKDSITGDIAEMEKMIHDLLETARMHHLHGKLKLELISLADLIENLISEYEKQPPGVRAENLPDDCIAKGDPEQIKTVFQNILTNAIKFSSRDREAIQIRMERRSPEIVVQITDFGIGIPEDELPFVFEPFYRVDKSRTKETGGFGLGLSLCKTIMEAHGGRIEIESALNAGTTVTLYFPE
jgi:signal transduction histidine kinase